MKNNKLMDAKTHFLPYNPQLILFSSKRLDNDMAEIGSV